MTRQQPHEQDDVLSVWAPDVHAVPASSALRQFLVAIGVVVLFGSTVYAATPDKPALPRTYPRDGLATELGGEQVAVSLPSLITQQCLCCFASLLTRSYSLDLDILQAPKEGSFSADAEEEEEDE